MTLQQKFLFVVSMLGLTLLGSLGAVWWAFGHLQRELSTPFAETTNGLEILRVVKRNAEDQARIIYSQGLKPVDPDAPAQSTFLTPGVRGPRGEPRPFVPTAGQIRDFNALQENSVDAMRKIERGEVSAARIGASTSRNIRSRIEELGRLGNLWFYGDTAAQAQTGLACYTLHELIEETEKQLISNATKAIGYGDTIRNELGGWLVSVIVVGGLAALLTVTLLRRWVQKPVSALREAAARIAKGDLQHRVPVTQRDELGQLSDEVNHMADMVRVMQDERVERERLAAIGEMVRRIVHNVRNPLAGIRGLAEVTRMDFPKDSPNRENMDMIVSTVDTFERWLTELLDATSPTTIDPQENDVREWLTGIVEIHRSQAAAHGVTLRMDASTAPEVAVFDAKHLDHAVSALVSNAVEATPPGGNVWITARQPHDNGSWEVEIVDTGRGVPPDVLPRIFDSHFTTKRHGSGLGLAMTQQIVKGHTGRISVRNGDDAHPERCGACFTIRLPINPKTDPKTPNTSQSMS